MSLSEWEIAHACGYKSIAGGLKALRSTLRTGNVHPFLAPALPAALDIDQGAFDRAIAETEWILLTQAAEAADRAERSYLQEFQPYVWARFETGSPKSNLIAMLGGIYRATYAFLPNANFDSPAAVDNGFRALIQEHSQRWWPSMPIYGDIIGYYAVSEPAAVLGRDLAVPHNVHGTVVGTPRAIERPQFLLTRRSSDPLSSWISHLDGNRSDRF